MGQATSKGNEVKMKHPSDMPTPRFKHRDNIDNHKSPISDAVVMSADIKFEEQPLTKLAPATQDEIRDIIIKPPSKSSELDPLPTYLLKEVLEYLLPLITILS